ncbi:hypothetical protein HK102_002193 [Quaeritorhiza haematococci]|nr:hypothetical protein HK102_002193 [Quaeritorhiza haematococci]
MSESTTTTTTTTLTIPRVTEKVAWASPSSPDPDKHARHRVSTLNVATKVYLDDFSGLSALYLYPKKNKLSPWPVGKTIWIVLTFLVKLITLRFMDDLKDWETDVEAHPDRPIPRGLVQPREVRTCILILLTTLFLNAAAMTWAINWTAGATSLAVITFQILMWQEYWVPDLLEDKPFTYAVLHQPVIVLYVIFAVAVYHGEDGLRNPKTYYLGLMTLGSTFAYEVGRKLDPYAHPMLNYYREHYGKYPSLLMILGSCGLGMGMAHLLNLRVFMWPAQILVAVVATLVLTCLSRDADPNRLLLGSSTTTNKVIPDLDLPSEKKKKEGGSTIHTLVEHVASLSAVWHVYAICVAYAVRGL